MDSFFNNGASSNKFNSIDTPENCLRVFEAFCGYGSQSLALEDAGVRHRVVGTSEIAPEAIRGYDALRVVGEPKSVPYVLPSTYKKYLKDRNIGIDFKTGESLIDKMSAKDVKDLYDSCIRNNNFGDVSILNPSEIPDHDLFTYSFPCTTLSSAGSQTGLTEGSGTKSSLLWECKKIIHGKKPTYLLMENVPDLIKPKFFDEFNRFKVWLEDEGYSNYYMVLNAMDYGIPQTRERVFMISILGFDNMYTFPRGSSIIPKLEDFLDEDDNGGKLMPSELKDFNEKCPEGVDSVYLEGKYGIAYNPASREYRGFKPYASTLCARDFHGPKVRIRVDENGKKHLRKLSAKEYLKLMGLNDEDYYKMVNFGIKDKDIYKMAGNSIVKQVMTAIFTELFKDTKYMCSK